MRHRHLFINLFRFRKCTSRGNLLVPGTNRARINYALTLTLSENLGAGLNARQVILGILEAGDLRLPLVHARLEVCLNP